MNLKRKETNRYQDRICLHDTNPPFLSFPLLDEQEWLRNGFSTRLGGVSTGAVGTMNLSYQRDTCRENVNENFRRITGVIGIDPDRTVWSWQTHTTNIRKVGFEDAGKGYKLERDYQDVDGLITDCPGIGLVTFYADCVPLLAADPVHHVIGAAHSGWRGTVSSIGGELIRSMQKEYGTDPKDVLACIGPSICRECYEVSEDVAQKFEEAYDSALHTHILTEKGNGKFLLDLQEACRQNFLKAGVLYEHISVPDLCTACNAQVLFSHRASKGERGLLGAFIQIRDEEL